MSQTCHYQTPTPVIINFNELIDEDKINHTVIDESQRDLYDSLMSKWSISDSFSIIFTTEKVNPKVNQISFKLKTSTSNVNQDIYYRDKKITGLSVCFNGETDVYYVSSRDVLLKIKDDLKRRMKIGVRIITFDVIETYQIFVSWFGFDCKTLTEQLDWFDPHIAHWLFEPESKRPIGIESLTKIYIPSHSYRYQVANALTKLCISTCLLFPLMNELNQKLECEDLYVAFKNVEMMSRLVLAQMEINGVGFDKDYLMKQQKLLNIVKTKLEAKAHQIIGKKLNMNSPKEVSKLLYTDLNLQASLSPVKDKNSPSKSSPSKVSSIKILPQHLSTDKKALKKLLDASKHPIIEVILNYRRVSTAISKAIEPMLNSSKYSPHHKMHRIHCVCEDWTATGRVSVSDPNLIGVNKDFVIKNITLEDNAGEQSTTDDSTNGISFSLRRMLIASKDHVLVSADFSQLELRILAHLSGDKDLQKVLNDDGDVFKNIAASWKMKSIELVTKDERQQAKQICYGMIYGIGPRSLSEALSVTPDQARKFMDSFINRYQSVKKFIHDTQQKCIKNKYAMTMNGRKRFLSLIDSDHDGERARAERQAVNSTIQGSAADLLKLALVSVQKMMIEKPELEAIFILQMYDEIMCEIPGCHVDVFVPLLRERIESCASKLSVNFPVNVKVGSNWGELV